MTHSTFNIITPRVATRSRSVEQEIRAYEERLVSPINDNAAQEDSENQSSFSGSSITTCFRKQSIKVKLLISISKCGNDICCRTRNWNYCICIYPNYSN